MKRLIAILFALLLTFGAATTAPAASRDSKSNSKVEKFVQGLARDYSSHVEYSYISMNMLKSLFSLMLDEDNLDKDDKEMAKALKSLRYIRKYSSSDSEGYKKLKKEMQPFLSNDDEVMGMELVAANKEGMETTTIYSSKDGLLIITDENGTTLTVVFIAGLSMDIFNVMMENGFELDF